MSYSGKRALDISIALVLLLSLGLAVSLLLIICAIDTSSSGLFLQERIGLYGKPFNIYKLRTLHNKSSTISKWGGILRRYKLDELPQIINILKGDMSFVGPRPDVSGYYDKLFGEQRKILEIKPGLTSEAALKYIDEENILSNVKDKLQYNNTIIFPDKVKYNLQYYYNQSIWLDLKIIGKTIKSILTR